MNLVEETMSQSIVYEGGFLRVRRDQVMLPDGNTAVREFILHPGAVAILALTADNQLIMERQYRYPVGQTFLEIPAGKVEPGEAREETARRELLEETGYKAQQWSYLATAYPCIGYADERISYYLAEDLEQCGRSLDAEEFLEVVSLPLSDIFRMTVTGEICDSKSLVGLYWLREYLAGRMGARLVTNGPVVRR